MKKKVKKAAAGIFGVWIYLLASGNDASALVDILRPS
jgi:hypothetical protein